ncbi:histidine kinase [Acinetobacter sp. ANC 4470]|uniref:sensor histidine kinase n=1 Tax=Acinetobacter sp. ANC 4470 TaxID=1977881 RepID=UPI000A33919D|nr:sensor histidine kinase KdpD [Acinetobacter sp. ANC 4470]OTG69336.1 histidine kinase [Acinetobacter sp. ANC 4470]
MTENRKNKVDVLLQHAKRYQSGRLTIFLGAAPGVGKTYAMLVRARELFQQGQNIVIAYIETHGRVETEGLIEGLPCIPRKKMQYQGHHLEEMDLDAVLEKKAKIVLVDEFAHTNMPGSRHEKRWQDINELLDAGIDVFTTMNIQHLESLNDVIYQITGIRVKETVPDRVFDRIRDIRLIDLPVNELLERLNQGKVYIPEQVQHALQGFFNSSNLTALRELAMQTVASHVDSDVRENFALQGLPPIPLKNHLLVMVDGLGQSEALVRAGCRLAENRLATWTVVAFMDQHQQQKDNQQIHQADAQSREIERALNLCRQLGGMTEILYGQQHAKTLSEFALERGISTLVVAQTPAKKYSFNFKSNLIEQLLKHHPHFELSIVPIPAGQKKLHSVTQISLFLSFKESILVLFTTIISIIIAGLGEKYLGLEEFSIIFITAVVFVASKTRMTAAACSAIIFFLVYNFFFIAPRYTFQISAHQGVITVVAFFAAALIASRLASRLREQVTALKAANSYNSIMQDLGQKLSTAVNDEQVNEIAKQSLEKNLQADVLLYCPNQDLMGKDHFTFSDKEKISAEWSISNQQPSGRFTQTLTENEWWFLPLLASKQCLGVVGLKFPNDMKMLSVEQKRLAETIIEYIAQAISRTQLTKELEIANVTSETEKLRSALLSSVSHDLRSPLASMIGAADTLSHYRHSMDEADQDSLLEAIHLEGERLDRYIQNLLDMTRLGHEGLSLKRDWIGIDELVGSAVRRLKRYLPKVQVRISMPEEAVSLFVHAALIEQAIFNVLENAAKFSPEDEAVEIEVKKVSDEQVQIAISDQGLGIPEDERNRIFDMFYTMQRGDRGQYGTGLGLTIVKAIIGAHMGQISATEAKNHRGTCIRIVLPIQ